jgi:disulfide bond formation protein DsbB
MFSRLTRRPFAERALIAAAIASAALLAGAHIFQALGYAPCPLCLDQREAHWAALGVALAGVGVSLLFGARLAAAAAVGALALVYAVSTGLAGFHVGVEYKWWPGPATCAAVETGAPGDLSAALNEKPRPPACEEAAWRFLGVSMAGYNFLASAGLFALTFAAMLASLRAARSAQRPQPLLPEEA